MDLMDKLFEATQEERVDDALNILNEIEKTQPLPPSLLVLRGMCMQISEDESHTPEDIKQCYEKALDIDADYVPALIELGHFYYATEDAAETALPFFQDALNLCKLQTTEALGGLAICLAETEGKEKALELLDNADEEAVDQVRLDELREEIDAAEEVEE